MPGDTWFRWNKRCEMEAVSGAADHEAFTPGLGIVDIRAEHLVAGGAGARGLFIANRRIISADDHFLGADQVDLAYQRIGGEGVAAADTAGQKDNQDKGDGSHGHLR